MLHRMTLAAAALVVAAPVMADDTCLPDAAGAQCDIFLDRYRADEVPVGTTNVRKTEDFLIERDQDLPTGAADETPGGENVLYWDGDDAMVVHEDSGPRLKIADW